MRRFSLLFSLLFFAFSLYAQDYSVSGVVTSADDSGPLPGVSVFVKGGTSGTITDLDGAYNIKVSAGDVLVFSCIGFKEVEKNISGGGTVNIALEADALMLDEVVAIGYGVMKKSDLTGSVSVVKMKDVADVPTGNVMQALQGRVAGMNVTTDGTPGGGNTSTLVRGTTTINNSSPLYVIDGMPTRDNVGSIVASSDIESIQVLKDASSAAIYGAQAANGVIIITTKKAKKGEIKVNFDMSR